MYNLTTHTNPTDNIKLKKTFKSKCERNTMSPPNLAIWRERKWVLEEFCSPLPLIETTCSNLQ